jgi:lysophospholipase L1-like esterase
MSIDLYPALDAGEIDVQVALEWNARAGDVAPLGAASLFYRNANERYPAFVGMDLVSKYDGITQLNVAEDGATIGDVFGFQLPSVEPSDAATLFTLSAGGNDLLSAFSNKPDADLLKRFVRDIADAFEFLVESLRRARPNSAIIVSTVYDPSDKTRKIPGFFDAAGPLPLESLHALNDRIASIAQATPRCTVADVHDHFQGHGVSAPVADRWYWKRSFVEPAAIGASEIRRLWLDALATIDEN